MILAGETQPVLTICTCRDRRRLGFSLGLCLSTSFHFWTIPFCGFALHCGALRIVTSRVVAGLCLLGARLMSVSDIIISQMSSYKTQKRKRGEMELPIPPHFAFGASKATRRPHSKDLCIGACLAPTTGASGNVVGKRTHRTSGLRKPLVTLFREAYLLRDRVSYRMSATAADADGSAPSVPSTLEERCQGQRVIVVLQRVSI